MWHGNSDQAKLVHDAIEHSNGMDNLDRILQAMEQTGALAYCRDKAELEADKAIAAIEFLPDSEYKIALESLAHIAVDRKR